MKTPHIHITIVDVILCALALWIIVMCLRGIIRAWDEEDEIRRKHHEEMRRDHIARQRGRISRGIGKYENRHNRRNSKP